MCHPIKFLSRKVGPMSHHHWYPVTAAEALHSYTTIMAEVRSLWVCLCFYNQPPYSPTFSGPHVSNNAAVHSTQFTPTSPTKQSWQGVDSRVAGSTVPPYVPSQLYPSSASRNTAGEPLPPSSYLQCELVTYCNSGASKGHNSSQSHGTASGSAPSTSSTQPRQNFPRCKLPRCDKPAIFDHRINEQREYCEEHIKYVPNKDIFSCES